MKLHEYQERMTQLKALIGKSNTGSPSDLAKKFKISERTVRRMVDLLKLEDESIVFCRKSNSYVRK